MSNLQKSYSELIDAEDDWDLEEQLLDIHEDWLMSPCRHSTVKRLVKCFMLDFDHVMQNMNLRRQWWKMLEVHLLRFQSVHVLITMEVSGRMSKPCTLSLSRTCSIMVWSI